MIMATKVGDITLDGIFGDWSSGSLVQIAANTVAGYDVYGKLVSDPLLGANYVIGLSATSSSDPVIGANTIIYLNTDQNASTGLSPWTGSNVGAEFTVVFKNDLNGKLQPYLYSASSAGVDGTPLNGGAPLNWAPSIGDGGKSLEIAIPQSVLTLAGGSVPNSINFEVLLNNSKGLPASFGYAPQYTITDPSTFQPVNHAVKKVAIIWSQDTANNYFAGSKDANGLLIPQAALTTAYSDLFMTAQHQAEAAGVSYDILTAEQLATMNPATLAQYSALVIPSMRNVKDATQAAQITNVLSQLEYNYHVGIITSGDFMTSDASNAELPAPYLAMQTLLGATFSTSGVGSYSLSVDPAATANPIMAGYSSGAPIGGASGQFAGTTAGFYTNTGYSSYTGIGATPTTVLADINVTTNPGPGAVTTSSVPGVIQTTTGGTNTLFSSTGLFGDSNLLQHVIRNTVFGSAPSLTLNKTRSTGILASRTDMDQSQFASDIAPTTGPGIYNSLMPVLQQWKQQFNFVGSFYVNVGNGSAVNDNGINALSLTSPYLKQILQMGSEIGSHSTDHLISPPGNLPPENANFLSNTQPSDLSTPSFTFAYEFGQSNLFINQALGITVAGAAIPGAPDTSATALNILQYYPGGSGFTGYVNGGWTGVGAGSPNAFGYIDPTNTKSVYIAPNMTFDFTEIEFQKKTPAAALADWKALFNQLSANSQSPVIVWPWHDYGPTDWNFDTNSPNAGRYTTQMFTDFVAYAYNAGYEFVTSEDLAARIAAQQRAMIAETNPTANTINVTVTPGLTTDDLGAMALDVSNGGSKNGVANVIQNAGGWYAYDTNSLFMARGGVSNVTVTLGATQDDVTHIDALPMRADLVTVTGDGSNLAFSMTGDGAVGVHVRTPGANIVSVQGAPGGVLNGSELSLTFNDGPLGISSSSPQGAPVLHSVTVSDRSTAVTTSGADLVFGGTANDGINGGGGNDTISGGTGVDTLTGGVGIDTFIVGGGDTATIKDLGTGGADVLQVASGGVAKVTVTAAWTATSATSNNGTTSFVTNGVSVILAAVTTGNNGYSVTNTGGGASLTGSGLNDTLLGGSGSDALNGGAGLDSVNGGAGADTLNGGAGADTLTGGSGGDLFLYSTGSGSLYSAYDTITDFGNGVDKFKIGRSVSNSNFRSLSGTATGDLLKDLTALLTPSTLTAAGADLVRLAGPGTDAGTYVVINNDGVAGFNSALDAVVRVQTGATVSASSFIV